MVPAQGPALLMCCHRLTQLSRQPEGGTVAILLHRQRQAGGAGGVCGGVAEGDLPAVVI